MIKADIYPSPIERVVFLLRDAHPPRFAVPRSRLQVGSANRGSRTSSDFPPITLDRWLENFARLGFTDDCGRSSSRRTPPGCRG
jgi:hypothetical protein